MATTAISRDQNPAAPPAEDGSQAPLGRRRETPTLTKLFRIIQRRQRLFVITTIAITAVQITRTIQQRYFSPVYRGSFSMLVTDPIREQQQSEGGGVIESLARNTANIDLPTLLQVLESPSVLAPVKQQLLREGVAGKNIPSISVASASSPGGSTAAGGVIRVTGKGPDQPSLSRALQLTEEVYLNWATTQRQERLNEGLKFLETQEPTLRSKSDVLQQALKDFREDNGLVEPLGEAQAVRQNIEATREEISALTNEKKRLQTLRSDIATGRLSAASFKTGSQGGDGQSGLAAYLPSQALLDEQQQLEQEIADARTQYQPDSSVLKSLEAAYDDLVPKIKASQLEAVDAAIQENTQSLSGKTAQLRRLEYQFAKQPELLRQYDALQQRLAIADGVLDSYLNTREQFQLEVAQRSSPWKIINPTSVTLTPVEPSLGRGAFQGLILGMMGGVGVALLRDRLDHIFHNQKEVSEDLGAPILGHLPHVSFFDDLEESGQYDLKGLDGQVLGTGGMQRFAYQESLRNLYTSVRLLRADKQLQSIGITSTIPSEGKTLLNILFAKTLSELGTRVLLVDADLRKPQLHKRLAVSNIKGLSHILTSADSDWRDSIQNVEGYPGWSVLTAGVVPPDAPRLLGSARMGNVVRELSESNSFDVIIYDTPPALGLADTILIAQHLDGILLLVSLKNVDRSLPEQTLDRIRDADIPLLGVVTNSIAPSADDGLGDPYQYGGTGHYHGIMPYGHYATLSPTSSNDKRDGIKFQLQRQWRKSVRKASNWLRSL